MLRVELQGADALTVEPVAAEKHELSGVPFRLRLRAVEDGHDQLHVGFVLLVRVRREQARLLEACLLRVLVTGCRYVAGEVICDDFAREADDL